jgi:hypothetical protein
MPQVKVHVVVVTTYCRMEKLDLKTGAGLAKVFGTIVGFTGAIILALYQGPSLMTKSSSAPQPMGAGHGAHRWVTGSVALLAGAACWSFWFILQSRLGKKYPALWKCLDVLAQLPSDGCCGDGYREGPVSLDPQNQASDHHGALCGR